MLVDVPAGPVQSLSDDLAAVVGDDAGRCGAGAKHPQRAGHCGVRRLDLEGPE